ncbi:hypothetical protein [Granulicella sp. dw_53]|uniref:hypothetical protein n=1 Tax=Granulicella sp. dw_53 TaxID=2719792 RepID=UPI001BD5CE35|nr:hypothetical protein [Granulicella sp. dw_53]
MRSFLRLAYRAILQLHPYAFRAEFSEEMLWIFDQQLRDKKSRDSTSAHLLFDGVRSLVTQHAKPRIQHTETVNRYYCEIDSSLPAFRFTQAGMIVLSCLCCLFSIGLFVSMMIPKLTVLDAARQKDWLLTRVKIFSSLPTPAPQRSTANLRAGVNR